MSPRSSTELQYELEHLDESLPHEPRIVYVFAKAMAEHAPHLPLNPRGFVVASQLAELELQNHRDRPSVAISRDEREDFAKCLQALPCKIPRIAKALFDETFACQVSRGLVYLAAMEKRFKP